MSASASGQPGVSCVCVCVCVCVRARACVRACVYVCQNCLFPCNRVVYLSVVSCLILIAISLSG